MDPMSQMIESLPQAPQGPDSSFMQPLPTMGQQPYQQQPQQQAIPPMQVMPQYQQVAPQAPAYGQPAPQIPQMPQGGQPQFQPGFIPGAMPQAPMIPQFQQPNNQVPEWAQQLAESVQQLQGGGGGGQQQPTAFDPSKPWSSDNRPKSWDEMRQANEAMATAKAQEIVTQTLQEQQQQAQQQAQAEQQASQAIDSTFSRLRLSGALPQIANPNDPNDPGRLAERELLGYTMAMGGARPEDMIAAAPALLQKHSVGEYYDVKSGQMARRGSQTPAAYAPIAGGAPSMSQYSQPAGPTQSQLAMGARDLSSLMQMGMDAIQ